MIGKEILLLFKGVGQEESSLGIIHTSHIVMKIQAPSLKAKKL